MAYWRNSDGLDVRFGTDEARDTSAIAQYNDAARMPKKYLVLDVDWDDLPSFTADSNNNGTLNAFSTGDTYIPAGSMITGAWFIVETAFAGGTSYDIGLYSVGGSVIDANGIDATLALAQISAANDAVACNGAQVNGAVNIGTKDGYVVVADTGGFTAGKAKLVIEYIQVAY